MNPKTIDKPDLKTHNDYAYRSEDYRIWTTYGLKVADSKALSDTTTVLNTSPTPPALTALVGSTFTQSTPLAKICPPPRYSQRQGPFSSQSIIPSLANFVQLVLNQPLTAEHAIRESALSQVAECSKMLKEQWALAKHMQLLQGESTRIHCNIKQFLAG